MEIPEENPSELILDEDLQFISKWTLEFNLPKLRDYLFKLWLICKKSYHAYGCINAFVFLHPLLLRHFGYQALLAKMKSEPTATPKKLIDVGCCFGQDVRQLILDGVSPKDIFAVDIHDGYWNVGREFFMDNLSHGSTRLDGISTIFDDFAQTYPLPAECTNKLVDSLKNNFDAVVCQNVFHVLTKVQTENIVKRICAMLKPGGILIGVCIGSKGEAMDWMPTPNGDGNRYLQSLKSLKELLEENGCGKNEINELDLEKDLPERWRKRIHAFQKETEIKRCALVFVAYKT